MKKNFIISILLISGLFMVFQGCSSKITSATEPVIYNTAIPVLSAVASVVHTATATETISTCECESHTFTITPTRTSTFTPTVCCTAFPDLRVTGISNITMDTVPSCVPPGGPIPPSGIKVYYQNTGKGNAGSFVADIQGFTATASGVNAGSTGMVWIQAEPLIYPYVFTIDSTNSVAESNETNNTYSAIDFATPSLPPTCVVTADTQRALHIRSQGLR